jgi:shikimate kinase
MDDYYAPHAPEPLSRSAALIGFAGAGVAAVGRHLRVLTGWQVAEIDREVEHAAGRSLDALHDAEGAAAVRRLEAQRILAALRADPPSVLLLGPDALASPKVSAALERSCRLVYLRRPLPHLAEHLRPSEARRFGSHKGCDLRAAVEAREADYRRASLINDAGDRPALRVAQELRRRLMAPVDRRSAGE